jgi:CBS-domain-containing membrane protein
MRIFDRRFREHKSRYVFQCALATTCVLGVLAVLDVVTDAVVVASLGASSFIVFSIPDGNVSRTRFLVGGYVVGCAVGTACYWLTQWVPLQNLPVETPVVYGALAVGLTMFLMVITNTEHPPAAGAALGLVVQQWSPLIVLVTMAGIVALVILRALLRPVLIRLV